MQTTTNYNMSKPEHGDQADILPISGNMDTIDTALHKARTRDADLYDETAAYSVNDYCIYADTLYRCIGATTGTWDSTKWTLTNLGENLTDVKKTATRAELTAVQALSVLPDPYDEDTTYNVGDLCMNGGLFKCIATTTGDWDSTKWVSTSLENEFERKHTWSLFETLTADGTDRFVYSSDLPEGITGVFINNVVQAGASAQTLAFNFSFDGSTYPIYISVGSGINTGTRYSQVWFEKDGNMWKTKATEVGTSATSTTRIVENLAGFHIGDEVKKARAYAPANEVLPSGSTFEIYIRR